MAKTDQPFKRLITLIGREFAAWVLNMDVRSVKLLSSEHTAIPDPIHSDLLFEVTLADGRTGLMPVEFQGRSSARPVRFRVLGLYDPHYHQRRTGYSALRGRLCGQKLARDRQRHTSD